MTSKQPNPLPRGGQGTTPPPSPPKTMDRDAAMDRSERKCKVHNVYLSVNNVNGHCYLCEAQKDALEEISDAIRKVREPLPLPPPARSIITYEIGSKVFVGNGTIEAKINRIQILPSNGVIYQCVWWDGMLRREEWMEKMEVSGCAAQLQIGFIQPPKE